MAKRLLDEELTLEGTIAWSTLLALVFLVPLTFSPPSTTGIPFTADLFDTPKVWLLRVGVMVLLAAWGSDVVRNGAKIRFDRVAVILFGVLATLYVLSTLFSIEPMQAFLGKYRRYDGTWSLLLYGALAWVTMQYATSGRRIKQLMVALSVSSVLVAGYGLLQAFGLDFFAWGAKLFEQNRSFSTYGNPNLLAGFLAFGVFVNLALALSEDDRLAKGFFWCATLLSVAVSITAFSRSLWVAGVVGLVVFALFAWRDRPELDAVDYGFAAMTLLSALAFIGASLSNPSKVMNFGKRVVSIFDFSSGSAATRFQIWDAAWRATLQRPLLGWGPDTFRMVFRLFQPPAYNRDAGYRSVADNAHNYLLQLTAGIGIMGALVMYVVQFWLLGRAARYLWCHSESEDDTGSKKERRRTEEVRAHRATARVLSIGLLAASVTYLIHLFFGISVPGATFLLWIALGVLMAPTARVREVGPLGRPAALACSVAMILGALGSSWFATNLLWADHHYVQAQSAQAAGNGEEALRQVMQSTRLSPSNDQYAIRQVEYAVEAASKGLLPTEEAMAEVDRLVDWFPHEYDVYLVALWAYRSLGQVVTSAAERSLIVAKEAVEKFPEGLALRYTYAEVLADAQRVDEAIAQLEFATNSDPRFVEAQRLLDQLKGTGEGQ